MKTPKTKKQILADPRSAKIGESGINSESDILWKEDDGFREDGRPSWWCSLAEGWEYQGCVAIHEGTLEKVGCSIAWAKFRFTPLQKEIIRHRLEVADCIADVLLDEDSCKWTRDQIQGVADRMLESDDFDHRGSPIALAILQDCISGSTYLAAAESAFEDGEMSHQKLSSIERALNGMKSICEL